jgi:hypothetical protein
VQGTVFYIDEVPAIAFRAGELALVVVEINTSSIFESFDRDRLISVLQLLPLRTMSLRQISLLMGSHSALWPKQHRWRDRVHAAVVPAAAPLEMISSDSQLTSHKSFSCGSYYSLGWLKRPFANSGAHVVAVATALNANGGDP